MTRIFKTAAITATMIALSAPAFAAGGTTPLGDCYNHVISACNQGSHPLSCAKSGMDACDEEHRSNASRSGFKSLRATAQRSVAAKFKAATGMTIRRLR